VFESLDKMMLAGLGAMSMTRERAEKIFDEYVKRGESVRATKTGFVKELMDSAERTRNEMKQLIHDQVHQAVEAMNLATKEDIQQLEKQVSELKKQLQKKQGG